MAKRVEAPKAKKIKMRVPMPEQDPKERIKGFSEVALGTARMMLLKRQVDACSARTNHAAPVAPST